MAESKTRVQFILQSRIIDDATPGSSWVDWFKPFDDIYKAIEVRELFENYAKGSDAQKPMHPLAAAMIEMVKAVSKNCRLECRIIKRTFTYQDEVVDEAASHPV